MTNLWQLAKRNRAAPRMHSTLKQGLPLNLNDATMRRLAQAYAQIQRMAGEGEPIQERALEISHGALLEVSNLLVGRTPQGPAEAEYVARRADALEKLARSLLQHSQAQARQEASKAGAVRGAIVTAISDFETRTGLSSLVKIDNLQSIIDQGPTDGR